MLSLKPSFCFYHIERCGGTSLRKSLYNYFLNFHNQNEIFMPEKSRSITHNILNYDDYKKIKKIYGKDFLRNIKILLCHCNFNEKFYSSLFNPNHFSITIVRSPLDRVISHYYFFSKAEYENKSMDNLSYDELKDYCHNYGSLMTIRLAGGVRDLNIAKQNVSKITFIILLENLEEDMHRLNFFLNRYYGVNYRLKVNISNGSKKQLSPRTLAKIYEYIQETDDHLLYQYIKAHRRKTLYYTSNLPVIPTNPHQIY